MPRTTVPISVTPASVRYGFKICAPAFIALAAIRTSGTKTSLFLNFSPITDIPLRSPSSSTVFGSMPSSRALRVSSLTFGTLPCCKNVLSSSSVLTTIPPILYDCKIILSLHNTKIIEKNCPLLEFFTPLQSS